MPFDRPEFEIAKNLGKVAGRGALFVEDTLLQLPSVCAL